MAGSSTEQRLAIHIAGKADGSLNAAVSAAQKALSGLGTAAANVAKVTAAAVGAATTAAVAFAKQAIDAGMEFETAFAQVNTIKSALGYPKGWARSVDAVTDFAEYSERLVEKFPYIIPHEKKDGIYYTVSAPRLTDYMLKHDRKENDYFAFLDTGGEKPPALWYSEGVYKPLDANRFKDKIKAHIAEFDEFDDNLHSSRVYDEVYKQILISSPRIKGTELNSNQELINFRNGLLNIRTMELERHTPTVYSTVQIPAEWKGSAAPCPVFDAFLENLVNGDTELQRFLWEYIAA